MIFNEVKLTNFGIYNGQHNFDFRIKPSDQNIILISAKNGSGKTTLLTAIKLGLYGPLVMGYRHLGQQYQAFIKGKLNKTARLAGENESSIILDFTLGGYGSSENIILERKWLFNNNHITEKVNINQGGKALSPKEVIEFENYIRKFWPPGLFDFFFFDGEEIHHQFEEGLLLQNFKEAFYSLFNLDLIASLQENLQTYLIQDKIFKKLDKEQQHYSELLLAKQNLQRQIDKTANQIELLTKQIEDLRSEIKQLELEFKLSGGLVAEERDQARAEILRLEQKKREESEWLKTIVGEILPLYLIKDLLFQTKAQITLEFRQRAMEMFADAGLKELRDNYWQVINTEEITISKPGGQDYSEELLYSLIKRLAEIREPINIFHDLNEAEKDQLFSLTYKVEVFDPDEIANSINNISKYNSKIRRLLKKIEMNKENEELNRLLQLINKKSNEIFKILGQNEQLLIQHNNLIETHVTINSEFTRAEKLIKQEITNENIFAIVKGIDHTLSQFQHIIIEQKMETMKAHFFDCLTRLLHKDKFIVDIKLNFEDNRLKIQLYDTDGLLVSYGQLSAGEKQVFLLSLTWALLRTSQREVPLFFDTLLGRLDQDHRENIIQKFLPYISSQVVVLSTDTEINQYYYEIIKPYIVFEYNLDHKDGMITIQRNVLEGENMNAV